MKKLSSYSGNRSLASSISLGPRSMPYGVRLIPRAPAQLTRHSRRYPLAHPISRNSPSVSTASRIGRRSSRQRFAPPEKPDWRMGSVSNRYDFSRAFKLSKKSDGSFLSVIILDKGGTSMTDWPLKGKIVRGVWHTVGNSPYHYTALNSSESKEKIRAS